MSSITKPHRFNVLDLTRFFAALAVVLYHYTYRPNIGLVNSLSAVTKFGYLGVPLFFMISGFVICASAQNRSAMEFAASRFARLYPAYWAGIAVTLTILYFLPGISSDWSTIAANMTMLNDYVGISDIDGVYWTLHVELKFYALIFFLVMLGWFARYRIWLSIWLALTLFHHATGMPEIMGWFINPGYSCFFIAGICFFLIRRDGQSGYLLAVLAVSFGLALVKVFEQATGFMTSPSRLDQAVASGIVAGCFGLFWLISSDRLRLPRQPVFLVLGGLTYPLYLIHNLAGKAVIESFSEYVPGWIAILFTIVLMLVLSLGIARYVERPFATPLKQFLLRLVSTFDQKRS